MRDLDLKRPHGPLPVPPAGALQPDSRRMTFRGIQSATGRNSPGAANSARGDTTAGCMPARCAGHRAEPGVGESGAGTARSCRPDVQRWREKASETAGGNMVRPSKGNKPAPGNAERQALRQDTGLHRSSRTLRSRRGVRRCAGPNVPRTPLSAPAPESAPYGRSRHRLRARAPVPAQRRSHLPRNRRRRKGGKRAVRPRRILWGSWCMQAGLQARPRNHRASGTALIHLETPRSS